MKIPKGVILQQNIFNRTNQTNVDFMWYIIYWWDYVFIYQCDKYMTCLIWILKKMMKWSRCIFLEMYFNKKNKNNQFMS